MFSKIMVALDTSEICAPVFDRALALAQAMNAELKLLSTLPSNGDGTLPLVSYPGVTGYPLVVNEAAGAIQKQQYEECKARGPQHSLSLCRSSYSGRSTNRIRPGNRKSG